MMHIKLKNLAIVFLLVTPSTKSRGRCEALPIMREGWWWSLKICKSKVSVDGVQITIVCI